jgi:hypothetical protein
MCPPVRLARSHRGVCPIGISKALDWGYRMYLLTLRMALMRAYRWAILSRLIALPHRSRDISLNRSLIALRPSGAVP